MNIKGVILEGGLGTGLRPLTHTGAKQLIPVANKPVAEYWIEGLVASGVGEIGMIVGYTQERIESVTDAIGDGSKWGVNITFIEQDAPRGIAHAVLCAKDFVGENPFIVYLGDNILKDGIVRFVKKFSSEQVDAGLLLAEVDDPRPYGVAEFDSDGNMVDVHEKPQDPPSNMVVIGIYYFSPRAFQVIEGVRPSSRGEYEISDALQQLIKSNKYKVRTATVEGWWDDTGSAEAILRANRLVMTDLKPYCKGTVEETVRLTDNVAIGEGSVIKAGTVIRGPVIIGRDCEIGPTYLGPYTSVGDNCTIKRGQIESSILIGDIRIDLERDQRIVDSLVGRHSHISSASRTLPSGYKLILGENSEAQI